MATKIKGHWLDELFESGDGDGGGVRMQWDGAPMPDEPIIDFGAQFALSNDSAGGRNVVTIRFVNLDGDVVGDSRDNIIERISGDGDGGEVAVFATAFQWDPSVSEGEAEISLSGGELDAGALQLVHNGRRALLALGSSPELGNDHAINRLTGGLRLTTRSITTNVSLDTTTKDAIGWIDAATERQVTLPPASVGRTFVLPFVGPTTPTLRRLGSELINGVASHYAMEGDAQGGLTIAVSDGVNWVARTIRATVSGATSLVGDVNGDTDANYISQITGTGGEVLVLAENFIFTTNGDAELKTASEGDGAIELTHGGTRVVYAHATTPEFGADYGLNRMRGGMRYTVRNVDGAIDETTTDVICWIDATTEGSSATLPTATQGRTLFFPFVGPESATLQRLGSELINGVASDYDLQGDANGGLAIAVCDGVNWVARTIGAVPASTGVDPSRAINTTAPLTGGGTLAADLTLGINPAAYVAPTRSISVTAPLTGGGNLSADRTIGIDTSSFTLATRSINTTPPLTGGGNLSADRTLAVSDATGLANGVVRLAGNIGGTAAAPLVTGMKADTFSFETAAAVAKGSWTTTGLRVGDATAPTYKLEAAGIGQFGSGNAKAFAGSIPGQEATQSAFFLATSAAPSTTNYALMFDSTFSRFCINAPAAGAFHAWRINGVDYAKFNSTGLRIGDTITTNTKRLEVSGATGLEGNCTIGKTDNTSAHSILGSQTVTVKSVSATFTIDTTTLDYLVLVDATSAGIQINLPTPSLGRLVRVKRTAGTNSVDVRRSSGLIEAASMITARLATDPASSGIHPYVTLIGNGTDWRIINHFSCTLQSS